MAGHSRSKNGVASLAYVPAIHVFLEAISLKVWMPGTRQGMTSGDPLPNQSRHHANIDQRLRPFRRHVIDRALQRSRQLVSFLDALREGAAGFRNSHKIR